MNNTIAPHWLDAPLSSQGIGSPTPRVEDEPLLRGQGRYVDDIQLPHQLHVYVVRSPHAAAHIRRIDKAAALACPGVAAVLTADDLAGFRVGPIESKVPHKRPDGSPHQTTPYGVLADGYAAHLGDAVAAVVAQTLNQAKDAAEQLDIAYEPVDAVVDAEQALQPHAPRVWPGTADNVCFAYALGDRDRTADVFRGAAHVVRQRIVISRVATASMEPRAAIGHYDARSQRYTLHAGLQMPHEVGRDIAKCLGLSPADVRVVSPDVGGAFGMKLAVYQEYLLVLLASRLTGRPVRWIGERGESFASDQQARDTVSEVELALDASGRFLALRVDTVANLGAYIGQWSLHVPTGNLGGLAGPYRIGCFGVRVRGVFTHTVPVGPYRGAGRPEASYLIERMVDLSAQALAVDPAELRRRNLVQASDMPYETGLVFTYDCGDFPAVLDDALMHADWQGFAARREAAKGRGKLRGIGMAYAIESAGGPAGKAFDEHVEIRFDSNGKATVLVGSHSHGQGHETVYRQFAAEYLSLPADCVRVLYGDTDLVSHGRGSFGSRTMMAGGAAFKAAAEKILDKMRLIAGHLLSCPPQHLSFAQGAFTHDASGRSVPMQDVVRTAFNPWALPDGVETGLQAVAANSSGGITFPNGCHVCEVEIDRQTGQVAVVAYHVVEDVGTVVNPLLVKGQMQGGVVQGIGQALMERIVYDAESGQLITGSFMDYAMPRADDVCDIHSVSHPVPTQANPLGAKGAGEAGAVGSLPAVMNAVCNALSVLGVRHLDMPATPARVWAAMRASAGRSAES